MIAKRDGQCSACYRFIPEGTEVGYRKGRGIRHLGGCAPITTEDLAAGRARFAENEGRRAAEQRRRPQSFARHDAVNEPFRAALAVAEGAA